MNRPCVENHNLLNQNSSQNNRLFLIQLTSQLKLNNKVLLRHYDVTKTYLFETVMRASQHESSEQNTVGTVSQDCLLGTAVF